MSITYSNAAKNARLQAVISLIDAQATPGKLEFYNGATILADEVLSKPSATVAAGVATFAMPVTCTVAATGTAVSARLIDGSGTVVLDGLTVATSGANINLNTTSLVQNQNLTINSFTITGS